MSEPTTFKDVPEDVKAKARTLAVTVLNMGDVEIATGFMAGVLLHTSNTLIEEQAARIDELERENFALAANQCGGGYSGEHGDHMCRFRDMADGYGKLDADYAIAEARLSEAVKVLEPFARYLDEHPFDLDNKGNMLPDDTQPGWTYLNAGQFRAAKAFITTLGENKN